MNNRFKFRAWDLTDNRYLDEFYIHPEIGAVIYSAAQDEDNVCIEKCTTSDDKKGSLIFEGDIVKTDCAIGLVCFGEYGDSWSGFHLGFYINWLYFFDLNQKPQFRKDFMFWVNEREIEITGNIHENPELLKEDK